MIVGRYSAGQTISEISRALGITRKTVKIWLRRYEEEGHVKTRPRPGRPRVTSPEDDRTLLEAANMNPQTTAVTLTREVEIRCHVVTTRRRLREGGLRCHVPAMKEQLTEDNSVARLRFAERYVHENVDFWRSVIFSDEKTFTSVSAEGRHCWRTSGTRFEAEHIQEQARSDRVSVSFHGWMWFGGPGELVTIEGHLNSEEYVNILETSFLPAVHMYAIPEPLPIWLVQDRSPIHTSHLARNWFSRHPEVRLIDWPPKGPDCNPIENLWGIMMQEWGVEEKTRQSVERKAREVWEGIRRRPEICSRLTDSVPRRLQEVIQAQGGWTKY